LDLNATDNIYATTLIFNVRASANRLLTFNNTSDWIIKPVDTSNATGIPLSILGDDASAGNNNGGNITLQGGAGTGTGLRGNIIFLNLPTSAAGLPSGSLWNNANVLTIVP
jgi:hypothetical protein